MCEVVEGPPGKLSRDKECWEGKEIGRIVA